MTCRPRSKWLRAMMCVKFVKLAAIVKNRSTFRQYGRIPIIWWAKVRKLVFLRFPMPASSLLLYCVPMRVHLIVD